MHMENSYSTARKRWFRVHRGQEEGNEKLLRASMATEESREEFVQRGLALERAAMHIKGASDCDAIELD